ncbi:MAG: right-handed parallel beta-helix repeat-containing protein, partial [Thermodesulfovibrionales bacterium]
THLIEDCNVSSNSGDGIYAGDGSTVSGNTAGRNVGAGIYAYAGCTVKNNSSYFNDYYGIYLGSYSLVDGNTAYLNNQSGGSYANISTCGTCVFGNNCAP